jgi:hypothetical protein
MGLRLRFSIYGSNSEYLDPEAKITGGWTKFCEEEFYNFYSSSKHYQNYQIIIKERSVGNNCWKKVMM